MSAGRPLRFAFFLQHAGLLRYFAPVVRLLAERGHTVHLAFSRIEKEEGDARLARELGADHVIDRKREQVGEITLAAGRQEVVFRSAGKVHGYLIDLKGIRLVPLK